MSKEHVSLEKYARRRFVLSGTAVVKDYFPYCRPMEDIGVQRLGSDGSCTSFAHYDYLALEKDPRIRAAARLAIDKDGVGAGA